jgi:hypothetical protein
MTDYLEFSSRLTRRWSTGGAPVALRYVSRPVRLIPGFSFLFGGIKFGPPGLRVSALSLGGGRFPLCKYLLHFDYVITSLLCLLLDYSLVFGRKHHPLTCPPPLLALLYLVLLLRPLIHIRIRRI